MKTMKRIVALLLGGVMMLGLLAGCGKKTDVAEVAIANVNSILASQNHDKLEQDGAEALKAAVALVSIQDSDELLDAMQAASSESTGYCTSLTKAIEQYGYDGAGILLYDGKLSSEEVAAKVVNYINNIESKVTRYEISGISIEYATDKDGDNVWVVAVTRELK